MHNYDMAMAGNINMCQSRVEIEAYVHVQLRTAYYRAWQS